MMLQVAIGPARTLAFPWAKLKTESYDKFFTDLMIEGLRNVDLELDLS